MLEELEKIYEDFTYISSYLWGFFDDEEDIKVFERCEKNFKNFMEKMREKG